MSLGLRHGQGPVPSNEVVRDEGTLLRPNSEARKGRRRKAILAGSAVERSSHKPSRKLLL
jgi:hypothetical protein